MTHNALPTLLAVTGLAAAAPFAAAQHAETAALQIPQSVQHEHEEIHSALVQATQAPGRVGEAARALADVLLPHFEREEEIALPPLGLLAPLAAGEALSPEVEEEALTMTATLRDEMPQMLEEHVAIHAAVEELRTVARAEGATAEEALANALAVHAETEEQVLYPAAMLVGDLIRARREQR